MNDEARVVGDGDALDVEMDGGVVLNIRDRRVRPRGRTEIVYMGPRRAVDAESLGQVDLWDHSLEYGDAAIELPGFAIPPGGPGLAVDVVHTLGVKLDVRDEDTGPRALAMIRYDALGRPNVFWRSYHRSEREVGLLRIGHGEGPLGSTGTTECELHPVFEDEIPVPVLAGVGQAEMGTIRVGVAEGTCRYDATFYLTGRKLREPIGEIVWSAVLDDGTERAIAPGENYAVDVDTGTNRALAIFRIEDGGPSLAGLGTRTERLPRSKPSRRDGELPVEGRRDRKIRRSDGGERSHRLRW